MAGGAVSRTVICWTQVLLLPQSSVAVQVRLITFTVAPGNTGGCGGNGPRGGCSCGGGRAVILDRFPSESVWTPTVSGTGGSEAFCAETRPPAPGPPGGAGNGESRTH